MQVDWRQEDEHVTQQTNAVFAAVCGFDRGDTAPYEVLETAMGVPRESHRGKYVLRKVRTRILRERGIVVWPETSVGWRFLTDEEAAREQPRRRQRRSLRQLRHGIAECSAVRCERLSMHERRLLVANMQAMESERNAIAKSIRSDGAARRTETLPRPKVVAMAE